MSKPMDPDIKALRASKRGLDASSSRRMLEANLMFLWDHYIGHPSPRLPSHLRDAPAARKDVTDGRR